MNYQCTVTTALVDDNDDDLMRTISDRGRSTEPSSNTTVTGVIQAIVDHPFSRAFESDVLNTVVEKSLKNASAKTCSLHAVARRIIDAPFFHHASFPIFRG